LSGQIDLEDKTRIPERFRRADYLFQDWLIRKAVSDEAAEQITDELRAKVRGVLFRLLRESGTEAKDSTEGFIYNFSGEVGTLEVYFKIDAGFFNWAIRTSRALMKRRFQRVVDKLLAEKLIETGAGDDVEENENPESDDHDIETSGMFAYLALQGMRNKLNSAFYELGLETEAVFEGFTQAATQHIEEEAGLAKPSMADEVRALSKTMADERKQFMMTQIKAFGKPRLGKLGEFYPTLLKVWQSAKKIYEGNSESERWRAMVKAKYPELSFDDELLTRVSGRLEDLPDGIKASLAETGGDHTPNTIALEHAARMCGATPYQYSVRHYHNLKTKTEQK
jgi:hypothetical protein